MPELIESNPSQRPEWADSVPQSKDTLYFVGLSNWFASETESRSDAYQNVLNQVVKYYGEIIRMEASETKSVKALSSDVIDPYIESEEMIQHFAQAYVHEILPENYYTEHWVNGDKDEWKCWVKCSVSKEKIQKEIETFAADISERHSSLLPENQSGKFSSTKSAVQGYLAVYEAVHKNPIYQAVAYVQTKSGKAALDEYALHQAKRIIQNITIEKIDYTENVEQGNDFKATIHLSSPDYEKITDMNAFISLIYKGKEIVSHEFITDDKNNIELSIYSEKLKYGNYTVSINLFTNAYKELGKVSTSSSAISFTFGYIKAPVKIEYTKETTATQFTDLGNEVDTRIENILQEKISENEIPIEIADSSNSNSQFTVQIKSTKLKAAEGVHKIKVAATVLFKRGGVTLAKSSEISAIGLSKASEEMAIESAFDQVCNQFGEDDTFYQNLLKSVGGKKE
ncbi:MAG: hypothetical protein VZR56_07805 [Treponema sp.]|nr:hypothetical protein [Treponema sp.]